MLFVKHILISVHVCHVRSCVCVYLKLMSMLTFLGKISYVFSIFDGMINENTIADRLNDLDIFRKSFIIKYKQMLLFIHFTSIEITFRKLMRIQIDSMDMLHHLFLTELEKLFINDNRQYGCDSIFSTYNLKIIVFVIVVFYLKFYVPFCTHIFG